MSKRDQPNTDVTVHLNTGDTVTYKGLTPDQARAIENTYTGPQVVEVVAVTDNRRR